MHRHHESGDPHLTSAHRPQGTGRRGPQPTPTPRLPTDGSPPRAPAALLSLQRAAGNTAVQRLLSASATYAPDPAALQALTTLDAQVATAEQTAAARIQQPTDAIHTARQANYIRAATPRAWGYCVEEQLDPIAQGQGWATQHVMPNARPDYYRVIGGTEVFADLTTAGQASPHGNHITGKLNVTAHNFPNATWGAADLVHSGQRPGHAPVPPVQTNGPVTAEHARHFQLYRRFLDGNENWTPELGRIRDYYGRLSSGTFTQSWDEDDRDDFVDMFSESESESEDSDIDLELDSDDMDLD